MREALEKTASRPAIRWSTSKAELPLTALTTNVDSSGDGLQKSPVRWRPGGRPPRPTPCCSKAGDGGLVAYPGGTFLRRRDRDLSRRRGKVAGNQDQARANAWAVQATRPAGRNVRGYAKPICDSLDAGGRADVHDAGSSSTRRFPRHRRRDRRISALETQPGAAA